MQDASQTDNDIFEDQLLAQLQSSRAVQLLPEVVKIRTEIWELKHKTELLRQQNNVLSPKVIAARNQLAALEAEHAAHPALLAQADQEIEELMEMNKQTYLAYATLKEQFETEEASKSEEQREADEKEEGDIQLLMDVLYDSIILVSDVIDGSATFTKEENITILKEYLQLTSKPSILVFCASEDGLTELVQEQIVRAQLTLDKLEGFTQDERGDVPGNGVERAVADGNVDLVEEEVVHGDTDGVETDADSEVGTSQQDQDVTPADAVLPDSQPSDDTVMEIGTSSADEEDKAESMVCEPVSAMAETETETLPDIAGESGGGGTQVLEPETEDVGPTEESEVVEDEVMCGPETEHKKTEELAEPGEHMEVAESDNVQAPIQEKKEDVGGEPASTSTAAAASVEQIQPEPETVDMPKEVDDALQVQEPASTSRSTAAAASSESGEQVQPEPETVDMPQQVDDALQAQAEQKSTTEADAPPARCGDVAQADGDISANTTPPARCADVAQADGDISANTNMAANSTSVANPEPASVVQNQKTVAPTNPAPSKEKAVIIVKQEPAEPVADDVAPAPPPHRPQRHANIPASHRRARPYLFPQAQPDAAFAYLLENSTIQKRVSRSYSEDRGLSVHGNIPFSFICAPLRYVVVKKEEPDVATGDGVDQASTITPRSTAVQQQRPSRTRARKRTLTSDRMIVNSANSSAIIFDSPDVQCLAEIPGRVTRSALRNARSALAVASGSSSAESSKKAPATKNTSTGRGRKTTQRAGTAMSVKKEEPEDDAETPVSAGKKNTSRGRGRKASQGAGKANATLVKKEDSADESADEAPVGTVKKEATSKRRSATAPTPKNKGGSKSKAKGNKKQTPKQAQKAVKEEVDEDDDVALGTIAASTTSSGGRNRKRKPIFSPPPAPKAKRSVGRPRKSTTGAVSATTTPAATAKTATHADGKRSRSAASASAKRSRAATVSAAQLAKNQSSESPEEPKQNAGRRRLRSSIPDQKKD